MNRRYVICSFGALAALALAGCGTPAGEGPKVSGAGRSRTANVVDSQGSSFVQPFFSKAFDEYRKQTGFFVNYTGGGSSAGIRGVIDGVVPFGASDAPMTDAEIAKAGKKILNVPVVLGTVPIVYNLPGVRTGLRLDGPVLADIFLTRITKWNDRRIAALNPGLRLPNLPITVEARADGSGTTYVLSDYLSRVSPEWKRQMGVAKSLKWGERVQQWPQSQGVANNTKSTPGAISYVELSWAQKSGLSYAALKNRSGAFVLPDAAAATAAASSTPLPPDMRVSIVDAPGPQSYPVSSYTFGLVPQDLRSEPAGKAIVGALRYVVTDAQRFAEPLGYAPLPADAQKAALGALNSVQVR